MLEKLAGRLKWERTGNGIRVVIPVRFPFMAVLSGMGVISLPFCVVSIFDKLGGVTGPLPVATIWVGLILGVMQMMIFFTTKHVLTLSPAETTVQSRVLGIGVRKHTFATSRQRNLRFVPSEYGDWLFMSDVSRVEIDRDSKARKFAFGITEQEADALIEKMTAVYNFHKIEPR